MSTLDEITKEKQRIGEALARVDAQREKLTGQLSELEAAERVLARYSKGTRENRMASATAPTTATKAAALTRSRERTRTRAAKPASGTRGSPSLSDQVLALATGNTQQEITAACKGARPNHVGAAIARHKRAGRIEERDGKLYATQSTGTEQRASVRYRDDGNWTLLARHALSDAAGLYVQSEGHLSASTDITFRARNWRRKSNWMSEKSPRRLKSLQ
jgi:hypothetical protein